MEFDLNKELIDQIIFGMENQEKQFYVDAETEEVVRLDEIEGWVDPDRYYPIPAWQSVHGYNLMERFVASLHNPIYREKLRAILSSGKGVFRQFKDTIKERSDMERLWFNFKEREMRKVVVDWYNQLRETWGLEQIDLELEDTAPLVMSDFLIIEGPGEHNELISYLDREAFFDMLPEADEEYIEKIYDYRRHGDFDPNDENSLVIRALTPAEELAGFIWGRHDRLSTGVVHDRLLQIYVYPEYRGLGIAKNLFSHYLEASDREKVETISVELIGNALFMRGTFLELGFEPFSEVLKFNVGHWHSEEKL